MLYKYYRYMLLIKIILLWLSIFMLSTQRNRPPHNWGTLFLLSERQTSWDITQFILEAWNTLPTPWAVLSQHMTWTTIHIPWTYDTWYVIWYIWQPLPPASQKIDETRYTQICKYKVTTSKDIIQSTTCHIDRRIELLWIMLLLTIGLLL